jgi:hypothetical protein
MSPRAWPALAAVLLACTDTPTAPRPNLELVDPGDRVTVMNSHVYGSFSVAAGGGVIRSGPANFPGKPKGGPGTCVDGMWLNSQGKATSGSLTRPHPHCFSPTAAIEVVLEPITACYGGVQDPLDEKPEEPAAPVEPAPEAPAAEEKGEVPAATKGCASSTVPKGGTATILVFSSTQGAILLGTSYKDPTFGTDNTVGKQQLTAYAIEAATLGTTNKRVGTLTIDLGQYTNPTENYLHLNGEPGCNIDETIPSPCFNKIITARYNPLPPEEGGIGPTDWATEGFLWVMPAGSPYNYTE